MARRQRTVRVGKPMPRKRAPTVTKAEAHEREPLPTTPEGVLEEMGKLCDEVDAQLAKEVVNDRRTMARDFRSYYSVNQEPWSSFYKRRLNLRDTLAELLDDDHEGAEERAIKFLTDPATLGTPPSFARPGFFVLWIDFMPLGFEWDGFIYPAARAVALDANKPWVYAEGSAAGDLAIGVEDLSVEQVLRSRVIAWTNRVDFGRRGSRRGEKTPAFQPVQLTPQARREVAERLEAKPWLKPILARGPVNPIPMPPHIRSIQMALV